MSTGTARTVMLLGNAGLDDGKGERQVHDESCLNKVFDQSLTILLLQ